ncbi:MAG: sulfite exporter TauE/SafE family protein [Candidatus Binatia bacterium]
MGPEQLAILTLGVFVVAFLYSSVGHAGASGYIAVMTLLGMAPAEIKPTALVLNILVASIGALQFFRAGHFSWQLFWPFALLSVPLAWVGGYVSLPNQAFRMLVGAILFYSAARFVVGSPSGGRPLAPPRAAALAIGGGVGLLSGLTGTGGGIFLTPVLLLMNWATVKGAAAVSVVFILLNSISGLLGNVSSTGTFPAFALVPAVAAVVGGSVGSHLGSRRLEPLVIQRLLAVVLVIAGAKLLFF